MERTLEILSIGLLDGYCEQVAEHTLVRYNQLEESKLSVDAFSFYTSVAAVFSSKIEGENIELDSYVKHKRFGIKFLPDYTLKTDDLYNAYQFAKINCCTKTNILEAHKILSKHILPINKQGKERKDNIYVTTDDGRIEYVAALPDSVRGEMNKFYAELDLLVASELNLQEAFYYASLLHLNFVKYIRLMMATDEPRD